MSSLLVAVSGRSWRATAVGGAPPPPPGGTILERIDAINGGSDYHWRLADNAGPTMADRIGNVPGTWVNTGDLEFGIDPLTQSAASGKCVGFGGAGVNPGHGRITIGGGGISIASQHTIHQCLQLDKHSTKYVLLTTGQTTPGGVPGEYSREFVDDGAGGMKPRVWTVNASGVPVIYVGTALATVPIGTAFAVDWIQENGSLGVRINGANIALSLDSGTPPGTWAAAPAGTLYVGSWSTSTVPLDGLASELAIWNSYVFTEADSTSLNIPANVVWARTLDAGQVQVSQTRDDIVVDNHIHPAVGFTLSVVNAASLGTLSVNGTTLKYIAGATPGTSTGGTWRITKASVNSPTVGFAIQVTSAGGGTLDLPYRGLLYGSAIGVFGHGNIPMRHTGVDGDSFFFYAEKTGTVTGLQWHVRIGSGYSIPTATGQTLSSYGNYTLQIRPANPATKRPIPGSAAICSRSGWTIPTSASANYPVVTFTTTGQITAGQPYCVTVRNSMGFSGYVSQNVAHAGTVTVASNAQPGRGPFTDVITESAANTIEPEAVGASPAKIRGWSPHYVGGVDQMPWPIGTKTDGNQVVTFVGFQGTAELALIYSDGDVTNGGGWGSNYPAATHTFPGGDTFYRVAISGSVQARIRFKVTRATRIVSGLYIKAGRGSSAAGNFVVTLESGVTSDAVAPDQNGSPVQEVTVNSNMFLDVGTTESFGGGPPPPWELSHFVWIPFPTNRTLTLGQHYIIRFRCTSSADVRLHAGHRASSVRSIPSGRTLTWTQWEAQREESREAWEDCKDGTEASADGGLTWQILNGQLSPVCFKCVV